MNFTEFLNIYGNNPECKGVADKMPFDYEVTSSKLFAEEYQQAIRLGLIEPDARVFVKKFNRDFDFAIDAAEEGFLSVTDWARHKDEERHAKMKITPSDNNKSNSGGCSAASPITKSDLEKYKMPYIVDEPEEEGEVMYL